MKKAILSVIGFLVITFHSQGADFSSLLNKYMSAALENNPNLKAQEQVWRMYGKSMLGARANLLPTLELSSRYTRAGGGREFIFDLNPFNIPMVIRENFMREREYETKFTLTQPLFTGGSYFYNYRASGSIEESALYELESKKRTLMMETALAYISFLSADEIAKSTLKKIERAEEFLRVSKIKLLSDAGIIADTLRAKAELALAKSRHATAVNKARLAKREFMRLTGIDEQEVESPAFAPTPAVKILTEKEISNFELSAVSNRFEIRQLEAAEKSALYSHKAARGFFLPTMFLAADYGWQGEEFDLNSDTDMWMVSGILKWNLFNGLRDKAKLDESKIRIKEIRFRQKGLVEAVKLNVRASALKIEDSRLKWLTAVESLKAAEENYRIRKILYETGSGTMLELMDAMEFLHSAEAGEIAGRYQMIAAQIEFSWSIGDDFFKFKIE